MEYATNEIWLNELGLFTTYQITRIIKQLQPKMYRNIQIIYAEAEAGYILGLSTNLKVDEAQEIKTYFYKLALTNL